MRRATITLSDELEAEVEEYLAAQEAPPSLTSLVQAALRSFLAGRETGPHRPKRFVGPAPPSEVAEVTAAYGAEPLSGGGPVPAAWRAGAPRLADLPDLLAGLPRLSGAEARELAGDLDRAREELDRLNGGALRDPWAPEEAEGAEADARGASESGGS